MAGCRSCGRDLAEGFSFCPFCGGTVASADQEADVPRERKVVSVVFCDVVGSTAAAEGADVEDVQAVLAGFHSAVRDRLTSFGGTVEKYVGDAVMAVFGVPVAHEDDAERAVRAGLALAEDAEAGRLPRLRVGVNTGEVLVVLGARPEHGESSVVGDVVNTAARIQGASPTNGVVVGDETYRATSRVFEYAELPSFEAKGKAAPVAVWQASAAKARFGVDVLRDLSTPMVGRGLELATLVNAFERAAGGAGMHLVTVVGEPGVGKSRLVAGLFAHLDASDDLVVFRQGRCLPYGNGIAFWALAEIVKAQLGIYDGDPVESVRTKLDGAVTGDDAAWVRAALARLLGVPGAETGGREDTFAAWTRFLESLSDDAPAVVVIEDLHWADPGLLDFLAYATDWARDARLLLVTTTRPELLERHPTWGSGLGNGLTVRLSPLSREDTEELITHALGPVEVPVTTQQAVVERSGGNPLYAEEFARLLREEGPHALDLRALPDTVQALITARVDTLDAAHKTALQTAAVVGKTFWAGTLATLTGTSRPDTTAVLHELARREFVRPLRRSSIAGEREYSFTHALIGDVAYGQLPRPQRARLHLQALDWIATVSHDHLDDVVELLTHHALTAHTLAVAAGDTTTATRAADLAVRHGILAARRGRELRADLAPLEALLHRLVPLSAPVSAERVRLLTLRARVHRELGRHEEAALESQAAVELAGDLEDAELLADALRTRGLIAADTGDLEVGERCLREAVAVLDEAVARHSTGALRRLLSDVLGSLGFVLWRAGSPDAKTALHRALQVAGDEADPTVLVRYWEMKAQEGDPEALQHLRVAVEDGKTKRPSANAANLLTEALTALLFEGTGPALACMELALEDARARRSPFAETSIRASRVTTLILCGRARQAAEEMRRALQATEPGTLYYVEALSGALWAELVLADDPGKPEDAGAALPDLEPYLEAGEDWKIILLSVAAQVAAAQGDPEASAAFLERLPLESDAAVGELVPRIPSLARTAMDVDRSDLAERLAAAAPSRFPLGAAGRCFVDGLLLQRSDPVVAADAFGESARRFRELGCTYEVAHALAGRGRSLIVAGREAEGGVALRDAEALFAGVRGP